MMTQHQLAMDAAIDRLHELGLAGKIADLNYEMAVGFFNDRWVVVQNDKNQRWTMVPPTALVQHAMEAVRL